MKDWTVIRELNHTYLVCDEDEDYIMSDFRFRMLRENKATYLVSMDIRNINGVFKVYYDITDLESVEAVIQAHTITYDDMENILKSVVMASSELEKFFCEEDTLVLLPNLIFKNRETDSYEFICYPDRSPENNYQLKLISFFMEHIEVKDEDATEGLFEIYDMAINGVKKYKTLYEKLISHRKEEEPDKPLEQESLNVYDDGYKKEERENAMKKLREKYYIPSLQESLAGLFLLSGIISVCVYIYLGWI